MASAAKAELGALYLNAKEAVYLQQILIEMGHPQPQTPIQTDNMTAEGVTNKKNTAKMHQSNGYAISLAPQLQVPRPIQSILATEEGKSGGLFYKTPPSQSPH
jgi:hypothetical protein